MPGYTPSTSISKPLMEEFEVYAVLKISRAIINPAKLLINLKKRKQVHFQQQLSFTLVFDVLHISDIQLKKIRDTKSN